MSKKRLNENDIQTDDASQTEDAKNDTTAFFWTAVAACAAGALLFGLTFLPAVGIYGAISAFICELAAMSFLNAQNKRNPLPACKIVKILCYIIGAAVIALLIGAAIYSSANG